MFVRNASMSMFVHDPSTSMFVQDPSVSTCVHDPSMYMFVHDPSTSMFVQDPSVSMCVQDPSMSTFVHDPFVSTCVHDPSMYMFVQDRGRVNQKNFHFTISNTDDNFECVFPLQSFVRLNKSAVMLNTHYAIGQALESSILGNHLCGSTSVIMLNTHHTTGQALRILQQAIIHAAQNKCNNTQYPLRHWTDI